MKLKPIIASMMVMLSAPAFAADTQSQLDSMKAQIAKMDAVINQNQNPNIRQADWFNRITISGILNADAFVGDRGSNFRTVKQGPLTTNPSNNVVSTGNISGSTQNLSLSNANLFVHALVNDWVSADINFVYQDPNASFVARPANASALDQAYVTIANFAKSPIFFRAGKLYEAFGSYERYPMLTNPTQLLSETSATTAQVGFVLPQGFYGSIAALQGKPRIADNQFNQAGYAESNRSRVQNGVANLGYNFVSDNMGAKVDVGYIVNMADVNYVADNLSYYQKNVPAVAVSGDFRMGWFDASLRYVGATSSFDSTVTQQGVRADVIGTNGKGARPQAYGIDLGATFPVLAHSSRVGVGYQQTKDAVNVGKVGMPRDRWYADYMVNFNKWSDIGVAYYRDRDYNQNNGGTGSTANVGMVRLSVKAA